MFSLGIQFDAVNDDADDGVKPGSCITITSFTLFREEDLDTLHLNVKTSLYLINEENASSLQHINSRQIHSLCTGCWFFEEPHEIELKFHQHQMRT